MGDLSELNATQPTKIAGADATGAEQTFVQALTSAPIGSEGGMVVRNIPSGTQAISFPSGTNDLYGRLRVSNLTAIVYSNFSYNDEPYLIDNVVVGAGARSGPTGFEPLISMTTTTASGDKSERFTRRYYRYQAARTHFLSQSILIGTTHANCRKRFGLYTVDNGIFWEVVGTTIKCVVRSSTSGVAVDTAVPQSSWNLDKLDGAGASGITLDFTKFNVFIVDYTWHGSGMVKLGILNGGAILYVHQFTYSNNLPSTYTSGMWLPIRWSIENIGAVSGTQTLRHGSFNYSVEQIEAKEIGWEFSIDNGTTTKAAPASGAFLPILAIRPKATFNNFTNRSVVIPIEYNISPQNLAVYKIILGSTLTGASWTNVDNGSSVEYDVSATAYSGGRVLRSGYSADSRSNSVTESAADFSENIALVLSEANATGDILLIAVRGLTLSTNTTAAICWKEIY